MAIRGSEAMTVNRPCFAWVNGDGTFVIEIVQFLSIALFASRRRSAVSPMSF